MICRIPLSRKRIAIIDEEDYEKVSKYKWYCSSVGYANHKSKGACLAMHRYILDLNDRKMTVDHINGNKLDNRRCNLRICTQRLNTKNKTKQYDNKSGYKGVYLHSSKKWVTNISVDNKTVYVGIFSDIIKAAKAYDEAAVKYYGEYAKLNFPDE